MDTFKPDPGFSREMRLPAVQLSNQQ